jgi:hypothetical protein
VCTIRRPLKTTHACPIDSVNEDHNTTTTTTKIHSSPAPVPFSLPQPSPPTLHLHLHTRPAAPPGKQLAPARLLLQLLHNPVVVYLRDVRAVVVEAAEDVDLRGGRSMLAVERSGRDVVDDVGGWGGIRGRKRKEGRAQE